MSATLTRAPRATAPSCDDWRAGAGGHTRCVAEERWLLALPDRQGVRRGSSAASTGGVVKEGCEIGVGGVAGGGMRVAPTGVHAWSEKREARMAG